MNAVDSATESDRRAVEEATGIPFPAHVDWNEFTLTVSKHTILAGSLEFAQVVAQKLLDLTWTFLVTTDDCPFIATDWPALITPPLKNLWVKFCKEPRNECFVLVFRGFRGKSATGLFGREIFCLRANTVSEQSFIKWCR